jgi:hypothetical protein
MTIAGRMRRSAAVPVAVEPVVVGPPVLEPPAAIEPETDVVSSPLDVIRESEPVAEQKQTDVPTT